VADSTVARPRKVSSRRGKPPLLVGYQPVTAFLDGLAWQQLGEDVCAQVATAATNTDISSLSGISIRGRSAKLSFYKLAELVELTVDIDVSKNATATEVLYVLYPVAGDAVMLDGQSDKMHDTNDAEHLHLDAQTAPDYVRYFLFGLRGSDGGDPFILFERAAAAALNPDPAAVALAEPLELVTSDGPGDFKFDAVMVYQGTCFKTRLAVSVNGLIEMTDDEPVMADFPQDLLGIPPTLGIGQQLNSRLLANALGASDKGIVDGRRWRRPRSEVAPIKDRSTLVVLVELLLERALVEQSGNRLLSYFNAALSNGSADARPSPIATFAGMVKSSWPVIAVESTIPFVEETIADIVNERLGPANAIRVERAPAIRDSSDQDSIESSQLFDEKNAMLLFPWQVYGRATLLERLGYELATEESAAILTCERFEQLPESLRRHADLVLTLPSVDEKTFEQLFRGVIGASLHRGWKAGGTHWVRNVLHTDFEHPRRAGLTPDDAFEFVRGQVVERLRAVDAGDAMALSEIHGMGEARQFAEDLISDIHMAMRGRISWNEVDHGALLVGPPGTGKTTLAKAIARGCGIRFIQGSASSWMAQGVTLGPHIKAIRSTFAEARAYAPSILFIDEIDSLGNREQLVGDHNSHYQTEVVNAVLEQMQGLDPQAPVIVIGATNYADNVDPALRRSGRLDRVIDISLPNSDALDHIYRYHLGRVTDGAPVASDVNTRVLARLSVGLTGADVERICRGAARRARLAHRPISQIDVLDEITNKPRSTIGTQRLSREDLERTSVHEAGHALASYLSSSKGAEIGFVSVIPRANGTLGFVAPMASERSHKTRREYDELLEVYLGGRAAEEIIYGTDAISGGATSDLRGATSVALTLVTQLGMGTDGRLLWTETPSDADRDSAEAILERAYKSVFRKLSTNEPKLRSLATTIAERQELSGDEVRSMLRSRVSAGG
jgi:AAA+ superfamily predicted ATPase